MTGCQWLSLFSPIEEECSSEWYLKRIDYTAKTQLKKKKKKSNMRDISLKISKIFCQQNRTFDLPRLSKTSEKRYSHIELTDILTSVAGLKTSKMFSVQGTCLRLIFQYVGKCSLIQQLLVSSS